MTTGQTGKARVVGMGPVIAIVTGSRDWTDEEPIREAIRSLPLGSVVYHGDARGADRIADRIAFTRGFRVQPFPAKWRDHAPGWCRCRDRTRLVCPAAGPKRNREMRAAAIDEERRTGMPVVCLAFPLPSSVGTLDMMQLCEEQGWEVRRWSK
jgi:hypothetical protein